mmetsp:Transcript_3537/g.4810  ORF Transcript_3537/g.4810 Transcript_3537/m.4810 type:complete len:483 (+) Transcript_3537:29-1477(+)
MLTRTVRRPAQHARQFGSLLNMFQSSKMPRVPLTEGMVDVPAKAATSIVPTDAPAITTLPNGLRVVTCDDKSPVASVGVFVEAGQRFEDEYTQGSSLALERMILGPTQNHSALAMNRAVAGLGTGVSASASKELITYGAEVLRNDVPAMLQIFGEAICNPVINQWDVDAAKKMLSEQAEERQYLVDEISMSDMAHSAAYVNTPLAFPSAPTPNAIEMISAEGVSAFMNTCYTAPNTVIAAVGVEHDEVVEAADKYFGSLGGEKVAPMAAKYQGGEIQMPGYGADGMAHVALSFESVNWTDDSLAAVSVLQMIMGGGGSFSAGGPGKGMYTRLYEQVLNTYGFVQSAMCSQVVYSDTGLFTLYGISFPQYANQLVAILVEQANKMAGPVNATELQRAKNLLKSYITMHLESRYGLSDDMGRAVIAYNQVKSAQELCKQVDAVTAKDVQDIAKKMLSTKLSVTALGDISGLPSRDDVARQITEK